MLDLASGKEIGSPTRLYPAETLAATNFRKPKNVIPVSMNHARVALKEKPVFVS